MRLPLAALLLLSCAAGATPPGRTTVSLAGAWRFELDNAGAGVGERWFARRLAGTAELPGSTATNHQGLTTDDPGTDRLRQRWRYVGKAWYQRDIEVPAGKRVSLLLERTKATRVWLDEKEAGSQQVRLFVPHVYDLTGLALALAGKHRLTIEVDNGYPFAVSGHALSDDTQTNWNGILGRIELTATDAVWVERVKVTPDPERRAAAFDVEVGNATGAAPQGTVTIAGPGFRPWEAPFAAQGARQMVHAEL